MTNQTLLIGVDAGDFRTIDPMLEKGELPNIKEIIDEGFRGTLESSIPPWTPTAWTSLTTGKNPGKHGIFDFKVPGTDELVDAGDVQTNALWDYFTEAGELSIVVNVPVTHPAREINGVLVPGYLGPEVGDAVAHPEGIIDELHDAIGDYRIYKSDDPETDEELCEEYLRLMQMRADAMTYLCDTYDWTFGMVQFQRTDTVFHELPEKEYIRQVYRKLDECIGQILSDINADNVIVASDHGMGETGDWDFRVNTWLHENGNLESDSEGYNSGWELPKGSDADSGTSKGRNQAPIAKAVQSAARIGITPQRIERTLQRIGLDGLTKRIIPGSWIHTVVEEGGEGIDIEASNAYCPSGPGLGIISAEDICDQLIGELTALNDPDGDPVFEWVRTSEEVYEGPEVCVAPDILLLPQGMSYYVSATLTADTFAKSRYEYNHKQEGVFMGFGPDISTVDEHLEAEICDIAPTVLSLAHIDLDVAFDGEPMNTALNDIVIPDTRTYETVSRVADESDRDTVEARLEDLGYME